MSEFKKLAEEKVRLDAALSSSTLDRRRLLVAATAIGAGALAGSQAARPQTVAPVVAANSPLPDLSHASMRTTPRRKRDTFVKDLGQLVDLNATNQGGAYWNYSSYITPIEQFYIRNEFSTPRPELDARVARETWKLIVHGDAIERPLTITYDDLLKMPSRSIICTMECAGNGRSLFWEQQDMTKAPTAVSGTGWGLGGIGQAEWQYVPMSHIFSKVGLKKNAKAVLFWSGVDNKDNKSGANGDRGRPISANLLTSFADSVGLAFKMNGQDLPADHGGPVRALVPGYCGAASTKWLTEIKIASHDFWVPLNSTAHVLIGPDYKPPVPAANDEFRFITPDRILGPAVTWSPPKSFITVPLVLEKQPKFPHNYPLKPGQLPTLSAGAQTVRGFASAPRFGVSKVEYRIDEGEWQTARIVPPNLGRFTWVKFEFPWAPEAGRHVVETRVTDRKGNAQPQSVPYNKGGFDFWAIPKFRIDVV